MVARFLILLHRQLWRWRCPHLLGDPSGGGDNLGRW
jgi:hypothetical protein